MIAVVVADRTVAFEGAVRIQLPVSCELLLPLDLFLLLGQPSPVDLLLLSLTVLLIAPLLILLRRAPLIEFLRRASLVCPRLLGTSLIGASLIGASLVVSSPIISLLALTAPVAASLPLWRLRHRLLVLILATAPIALAALGLCCRRNEDERRSCRKRTSEFHMSPQNL